MDNRILLHICCGPCATWCVQRLISENYKPILYYSNSNINSKEEFNKRLINAEKVAFNYSLPLYIDKYNHREWKEKIKGLEGEREGGLRCSECFKYSLKRAYLMTKELHLEHFTTSLTVSRYKSSENIFKVGEGFPFFEKIDFKENNGYYKSIALSKELDLYRQSYCGCEYSLRKDWCAKEKKEKEDN